MSMQTSLPESAIEALCLVKRVVWVCALKGDHLHRIMANHYRCRVPTVSSNVNSGRGQPRTRPSKRGQFSAAVDSCEEHVAVLIW